MAYVLLAEPCRCCPGFCFSTIWCCAVAGDKCNSETGWEPCPWWASHPWQGVCCCSSDIPGPVPTSIPTPGGDPLTIQERADQLGDKLGERLTPDITIGTRVKIAGFYNAVLIDVRGEVYVAKEATLDPDPFR